MTTATLPPEFQDLADGPGELGPADDGKVPAWSWPDRRLIMIPLPTDAGRQLIIRAGGGGGSGGGVTDHADLTNLDYASSGHTGFEPAGTADAAIADHVADGNPHSQYLLVVDYAPGVTDHGALTGLSDNDHPQYVPTLDTRANILASSPTVRRLAFATDTLELFYWTGSAWYVAPLEMDTDTSTPDMGAYNSDGLGVSDRQGYYSNVITDKVLHHMVVGHSDRTESGSFRVNSGELQVYLSSAWNTIVTGFRFQQDSTSQVGELEFRPTGYSNYYGVQNGNGNDLDPNGLPLVQQYIASMGLYAAKIVVDGGTF